MLSGIKTFSYSNSQRFRKSDEKKNVWAECGVVKYKYYFNLAKPFIHEIGLLLQISIHKVSDFKQNRCECKTRIVLYD